MKNNSLVLAAIFLLSICTLLNYCGEQKTKWGGSITEEDGITVVRNPKRPIYSEDAFQLEENLAITSPDDEDLSFQNLNYLVVDDAENIYVSDSKAGHILVFNKNGEFVRKIGKRGEGPGELTFPLEIQILGQKELLVNDTGQAKVHFFTLDGEFIRQMTTRQFPGFRLPKADSVGNVVVGYIIPGEPIKSILKKIDPELNPICEVVSSSFTTQPPIIDYFEMRWRTKYVWNVTRNDEIVWGNFNTYEIYVCDPCGKCIKRIVKEDDGISITKEEEKELIQEYFGSNRVPPSMTLKFRDHYPPFVYLTCDEKGRIFALSYATTGEDEIRYLDVFDSEGKYIAQTKTASFPQVWKNGMMYSVDNDEEGFEVIKRYRAKWAI